MFDLGQVLVDAKKTVEEHSATDIRFNHNYAIFQRLIDVADKSDSDEEFHTLVLKDFDLFCAAYIR